MPRHFLDSGIGIKECPSHKLYCKRPFIIDCPKGQGEIIEARDLQNSTIDERTDVLLIRTGSYRNRSSDMAAYCNNNPYFSPEAAEWIRRNLLDVRIVGIDTISISSKTHKDIGVQAHKILLNDRDDGQGPILILEDLYLPTELKALDELLIFPIFSADIDSSPCTVIGVIYG